MSWRRSLTAVVASALLFVSGAGPAWAEDPPQPDPTCVELDGSDPFLTDTLFTDLNRTLADLTGDTKKLKQPDPQTHGEWINKLLHDAQDTQIHRRTYVKDEPGEDNNYDCDDFASDLEKALEAKGYHATFTLYWCPVDIAHAVTDVHGPGDVVIWIESQKGTPINMDFNGDGVVGVGTTKKSPVLQNPTEGDCRIEMYESRAAAEAAGRVMDR